MSPAPRQAQQTAPRPTQPTRPRHDDRFVEPRQINCKVVVPTTSQRALTLLKTDFPDGEQQGTTAFSYKTIWEFRGERAKVECVFIRDVEAPDQTPAELSLAVIVDLADFQPHTAAYAVHVLEAGTRRQEGVEQMLGPSLKLNVAQPMGLV